MSHSVVFASPSSSTAASTPSSMSNEANAPRDDAATIITTTTTDKPPVRRRTTHRVRAMLSKLKPKSRRGQSAVATANSLESTRSTVVLDYSSATDLPHDHRISMASTVSASGSDIVYTTTAATPPRDSTDRASVAATMPEARLSVSDAVATSIDAVPDTMSPPHHAAASDGHARGEAGAQLIAPPTIAAPASSNDDSDKHDSLKSTHGQVSVLPSPPSTTMDDDADQQQQQRAQTSSTTLHAPAIVQHGRLGVPAVAYMPHGVDLTMPCRSESPLKSEFASHSNIYSDDDDGDNEDEDEDDEEDTGNRAVSLAAAAAIAASVAATASTVVAEARRSPSPLSRRQLGGRKPASTAPTVRINGTACVMQPRANDAALAAPSTAELPHRSLLDGSIGRILVSEHVYHRLLERGGALLVQLLDVHVVWSASPPFNPSFDVMWPFPFTGQQIDQYGDTSNGQSLTPESLRELAGDATMARVIYAMTLERDRRMLVSALCVRERFVSTYDLLRLLVLRYLEPFCQPSLADELNSDDDDDDDGLSDDSQYQRGGTFGRRSFGGLYEPGTGLDAVRVFDTWLRDFPDDFTGKACGQQLLSELATTPAKLSNVAHCHQLATLWMELVGQLDGVRGAQVAVAVQDRLRSCFASDGSSSTMSSPVSPSSAEHGDGALLPSDKQATRGTDRADGSGEERHVRDANRISLENILDIARPALNEIFITEKSAAWLKERQSHEWTALLRLQPLPPAPSAGNDASAANGSSTRPQHANYEEDPQLGEYASDYVGTDLDQTATDAAAILASQQDGHHCQQHQHQHQQHTDASALAAVLPSLPDNALVWPFIVYTPRATGSRASRAVTLPAVLADLVWTRESGADRLQKFVGAAPYLFHEDDIARIIVLLYLEALYMRDTSGADTTIARLRLVNLTRKWIEQRTLGSHACRLVDTLLRVVVTRDPDTATFAYPVLDKLHKTGAALLDVPAHDEQAAAAAEPSDMPAAPSTLAVPPPADDTSSGTDSTAPSPAATSAIANGLDSSTFPIRMASALAYRLLHADLEQLAARLVRLDHAQFIAIPLRDLVPPAKGQPRPATLERHAHWFDALAYNTAAAILAPNNIGHRADVLERVIVLADACLKHRAYNAAFALRATLSLSAIERLHATWNMLPAPVMRMMSHLEHVCSTSDNYATYRAELRRAEGKPAVPYLGLCLSDMMRLHESAQVSAALPPMDTAISSSRASSGPASPTSIPGMARTESGDRFATGGHHSRRRTSITESVKAWMNHHLIVDTEEAAAATTMATTMAMHPETSPAVTASGSTPVYGKENSGEGPMIRWQYWKRVGVQIERLRGWQLISYRNIGEMAAGHGRTHGHGHSHSHSMDAGRPPVILAAAPPVRPQRPRANTTPNDRLRQLQAGMDPARAPATAATAVPQAYPARVHEHHRHASQPSTGGASGDRHAPTEWRWRWLTDLLCNARRSPSPEQLYARSQAVEPTIRRESASSVLATILPMASA
ncbi:hypothetical protein SYNPS1DRAFT_28368 [Syncephalis pseudoplumigaleata]|uniref:Ras-GEF domain-containing protein n=1 Tax=Syncephalis pseudoplumigaleata TaxID=1712513 RepID=A0A4P9Z0D5_9FUNG|nr:hypothetical protein SYNPS1DRAFT_28368 [Syncephalis pseudoplumigaleata]|eukprot:RKP25917.1 hypothetical protein SYNPS1DRAFT_28368 [Syncephalis pseudoplumigaleata]